MIKTLKFKDAIKKKESMFEVSGYVSYYKAAEEANIFTKSVLEFSALIQMATEIIDKVDPENKDKFVYDKVEDFVKKIKVGLQAAKLKYLPRISQLCNNLFR